MWKIKDPELKRKMNQFISDEDINQLCKKQMKGISKCIFFFEDSGVSIRIDKSFFEEFPEYNPDGWNPFPAYRPPRAGNYLVYLNGRFEHQIRVSYFNTDYRSWDQYADASVLAFKELKIEPPGEDVLKFGRANRE
ncbi:hypothetical protein [Parasutterella excrementihominis]